MRVVVTGATGNVGTSLIRALSREAAVDSIVGIARRLPALEVPKVEWAALDVSRDDLVPAFRGADAVVHLAWLIQPSHDLAAMAATNVAGSERVLRAAADAGVRAVVHASSVGAYSPGPKDTPVDESWPTDGMASSFYAWHKAAVERQLDRFEDAYPEVRVVRLRPGLCFKADAGSGVARLFLGRILPTQLLRPSLIPVVPRHPRLVFQAVHTDDVAEACRLAVVSDARGAFNVAAEPVLDAGGLARALRAVAVPTPAGLLRAGADLTWRLHLQPTPPGWLDLALAVPVMDTGRIRRELGWAPAVTATDALRDLLRGMSRGAGLPTPPLAPRGRKVAA